MENSTNLENSTMNVSSVQSNKSHTKMIAAIAGGVILAAGVTVGVVYLIAHPQQKEQETVVTSSETSGDKTATTLQDGKNKITSGGTYTFTGSTSNGKIVVDTTEEVKIILDNVSIINPDGAAIKCKEGSNVTIELVGKNTLSSTDKGDSQNNPSNAVSSDGTLALTGTGSVDITAVGKGIKAETKLTITSGTYNINTTDDGLHSNGDVVISGGTFAIKTSDDGIHADGLVQIDGGTFDITAHEGIEGTYVKINDGTINISASDDGINAANKSTAYSVLIEINGGDITIVMGQGDTDALDSNGNLVINGGTLAITAQSPFDYDGTAQYNGGTMIVNGETTTSITNQFEGGMGGGMMGGGGRMGGGQAPEQNSQAQNQGSQGAQVQNRMMR